MAAAELSSDDTAVEVGPGTGVFTRVLAPRVKRLIAVEKDERLADTLAADLKKEGITNVEIIKDDILQFLFSHARYNIQDIKYKLLGNIPYYLTSRLLRTALESSHKPACIVFTVQKEVAGRIIALPPHMNLLGLAVQAFGKPSIIATVPASCFNPPPDIDSAIISISDISDDFFASRGLDQKFFFSIVKRAFSQKRKMLVNSLSSQFGKQNINAALNSLGISPNARPQELSPAQWAELAYIIEHAHPT